MKDAPKFQNPKSNGWRLVPDKESTIVKRRQRRLAKPRLLKRVVDEHPGTPWALLAERELKDSFGFKWVETHMLLPNAMTIMARLLNVRNEYYLRRSLWSLQNCRFPGSSCGAGESA